MEKDDCPRTNTIPSVALKEYLEKIIHLRDEAADKAMRLYQAEIERRLQGLNELRREVTEDRSEFLKKDIFELSARELRLSVDAAQKENTAYRDRIDLRLGSIDKRLTAAETRMVTWITALGIFFVIVNIVIHFLHGFK
jgi:DNA-binding PucR family transcriptional regulator